MAVSLQVWINWLERQDRWLLGCLVFGLIVVIDYADYLTGHQIGFSAFFLGPISIAAYFINQRVGLLASVLCGTIWLINDFVLGEPGRTLFFVYWGGLARLTFFVIVVLLLSALRRAYDDQKQAARTDHLTATMNSRSFLEAAHNELLRTQRTNRAFTLAYLDVDNFKTVNDCFGHAAGDGLLREMVRILKRELRQTDLIARLGGDEFAILFPETGTKAATAAVHKLRSNFSEQIVKAPGGEMVSLSIGLLTCLNAPSSVDEMMKMADDLMYEVKKKGKNGVKHKVVRLRYVTEAAEKEGQTRQAFATIGD